MKTICCKAEPKRIGKCSYTCSSCGKDVSFETILSEQAKLDLNDDCLD